MIDDWLFKSLLHHVSKTVQNWNLKLGGQMHHGILLLSMHSTEHPVIHKPKYTYILYYLQLLLKIRAPAKHFWRTDRSQLNIM